MLKGVGMEPSSDAGKANALLSMLHVQTEDELFNEVITQGSLGVPRSPEDTQLIPNLLDELHLLIHPGSFSGSNRAEKQERWLHSDSSGV